MKKLLIGLVVVVVIVFGAAIVAPGMIDWEQHKPKIQTAIHDATGYEVNFGGPIRLAVLPFPHVAFENLAIRVPVSAASAETRDLLTLKKAEVSVALAPLFRGEVSINSVNLVDPVVRMEIARDGRKLWMTDILQARTAKDSDPATPEKSAAGTQTKLALQKVQIENGHFLYGDAAKGTQQEIHNVNAVLSADSLSGPFKGNGDLVWNEQKIAFDIQSGRIDKTAQTISIQANAKLPANGTVLIYSGVVGTAGLLDLQGETSLESANLSATLAALTGKPSALAPLPFTMRGLLTARPERADLKNMQMSFGGLKADGSVGVANLQAKGGPVQVNAVLKSDSVLKAEDLMPVKSVKTVKAAANNDAPKVGGIKSFLPQTLKFPVPMDIKADIALAGLSYKGTEFGDVTLGLDKKAGTIKITENVGKMPGGGTFGAKSELVFASVSQGADKSGTVYSDPALTYEIKGNSGAPGRFLSPLIPETTIKSMQPLFKDPISIAAKGRITPVRAAIDSGSVSLGKTAFTLGASSYTIDPVGRDDVLLTLSGQDINLDHFSGKKAESPTETKVQTAVPAKPAGQVLQETLKKLDLPVDLTLKANLKNVTMQGVAYSALSVDGALSGGALDLKSAALTDAEGDVMRASGTVKAIHKLSGIDMTFGGKTGDAIAFLSSFKVDTSKLPQDFGPLDLSVLLSGENPESLAFNANAKALGGEGQANGLLLGVLADKPAVDKLSLRVTHPNFEQLAQKFNPSYKAGVGIRKDMDVYTNINLEGDTYTFSGLKAMLAGMDMTGTIKAKTGGAKPDVTAALVAGTIPLDILSGKNRTAKTSANAAKVTTGATNDVRWSRNAINTSLLHAFNLDLKVNAKRVEYGNWVLDDTILGVTIKDGVMNVGQMDAKVYGGNMVLTANVRSSGKDRDPLSFTVKSDFQDVGLEQLASSFSGARVIKARGNVTLGLEASSTGISPAALISALTGKGNVNGRNVVIEGFDLAAMSRSLVSTTKVIDNITGLAGSAFSGGETAFEKVEGPFTIAEGVIHFDNLAMTGTTANIANRGQISLPRWFIDMNSTIDLATPEDAPNLDIRFQGPLDNPGNTFAGNAMESYVNTRVNQKLQKMLGDKNPELNSLLNTVLGGGAAPAPAPTPAPVATPEATPAQEEQIAPSSGDAAPAPAPEQKQLSTEEQIMKGVLEGIMGR